MHQEPNIALIVYITKHSVSNMCQPILLNTLFGLNIAFLVYITKHSVNNMHQEH